MTNAYLGIDIGSISTKGVIIDEDNNILASSYLWTKGNPVGAVKEVLDELKSKIKDVKIVGVVKAFEDILNTKIITDKNGHLMGALGVAILSKKEKKINFSFDITQSNFNTNSVYCGGCPNNCEIICVKKDNNLIDSWGNRCDRGKRIV